jgi:hypothetical protein
LPSLSFPQDAGRKYLLLRRHDHCPNEAYIAINPTI